jgi:murein L,D-transpeptidase YcbB/YkuD
VLIKGRTFIVCLSLATLAGVACGAWEKQIPPRNPEAEQERLRHRLETAAGPLCLTAEGETIHCEATLLRFYQARTYAPAWTGEQGMLAMADSLLAAVRDAAAEGLDPAAYHQTLISELLAAAKAGSRGRKAPYSGLLVDLDIVLTDAFLLLGSHYLAGRINPETIDPEWNASRRQADLAELLEKALAAGNIGRALRDLLPHQTGYARLKTALATYRRLATAGGWPQVPGGPQLQIGDRSDRVANLWARLRVTGEIESGAAAESVVTADFDTTLQRAVRRFQRRHGLDADGVVGPATLKALDVPVGARIEQIAANLERWRWLPQDLGKRYILVNIADFRLDVFEDGRSVLSSRVIVGRSYRRTPVFSAVVTYLVLSPAWEVTPDIAVLDKLPLLQKDPNALRKDGFRVLQGWGAEEKEIDPETVDWSRLSMTYFPYRLRQMPGPQNALGRVKFMFPNKFNVYLHDTPSRDLFSRTIRMFSSGCIRMQEAEAMANYLLHDDPHWTPENIRAAMDSGQELTVKLTRPMPLHLLYWTAWVDENGDLQFREDIYERDRRLIDSLRERPPEAEEPTSSLESAEAAPAVRP